MTEDIPTRTCRKCGETYPLTDGFYTDKSRPLGRHSTCKECVKAYQRARREADPSLRIKNNEASKAWHRRNSARKSELRRKVRAEMIIAYGAKCACCGETAAEFLTMDHVGGWGKEHRAQNKMAASKLPYLLRDMGWPQDGFQLLCWNCNCSRGIYGYCPHGVLF